MKYPRLPHDLKQHIKLTVRDIELVRWLYHSGKIKSIARLASCFNTTPPTIRYWTDPLFREKMITLRTKQIYAQRETDVTYIYKQRKWTHNSHEYHKRVDPTIKKYIRLRSNEYYRNHNILSSELKPFKNFMEMIECHT